MNPRFHVLRPSAQKPGMGESLFRVPEVKAVLDCTSDVLGYDVAALMTSAPAERAQRRPVCRSRQPRCPWVASLTLQARRAAAQAVLGFSLGQVSALAVSGMLTYEKAFSFVAERARLMAQAAAERPGVIVRCSRPMGIGRAAVRGVRAGPGARPRELQLPRPDRYFRRACLPPSGASKPPGRRQAKMTHARLATSGAFHSPLMQSAADELDAYLAEWISSSLPSTHLQHRCAAAFPPRRRDAISSII